MSQLALGLEEEPSDPNADLVGRVFDSDHGQLRVVGTASWSAAYMLCDAVEGEFRTARSVALLRAFRW